MMMNIKKQSYLLAVSFFTLLSSCSDQSTELTSVEYDRLFAPIGLEARVVNRVDTRFTWKATAGAQSYTMELFADDNLEFVGTPSRTITDILPTDIPYTVVGLEGETQYSARIQAVSSEVADSKWSNVAFKTDSEQIFYPVNDDDLGANQVTLRWPADQVATELILNPGDQRIAITAQQIAAGAITLTGLVGETTYTARMVNGEKTRGSITFTTTVDVGDATVVYPEDDFVAMLSAAQPGEAFALFPGTYTVPGSDGKVGKLDIATSVEIKAVRPNDRPIINGCFTLSGGASLLLKQVVLDGTNTDGSQAFEYKTSGLFGALVIDDCEIKNYTKGFYYVNIAADIERIEVTNNLIYNIECSGGDFLDSRTGAIRELIFTNNTVYNSCAARDFVRYDNAAANFPGVSPLITIEKNTLVGVANSSSRRLLYIRFAGNSISFRDNLVTSTLGIFSNQSSTGGPTFKNNNYFGADGLFTGGSTTSVIFDDSATKLDPGFANAASGDFTLSNEILIERGVGAARWR
ncbi:MAG: DUF4957 domain-containing protein [Phocaeicola sp.]